MRDILKVGNLEGLVMNSLLLKLICGGVERKSRLHDEKGNIIPLNRLLLHGPLAAATWAGKVCLGYRPSMPWMSFTAVGLLRDFLDKEKIVLEFGSGMSTVWYAKHAAFVHSCEDYEPWHRKVKLLLEEKNVKNIDYAFLEKDRYCRPPLPANQKFDLIIIDGSNRSACAVTAIKVIADGGVIYLDNSDKHSSIQGGDTRHAEKVLLHFSEVNGAKVKYFVDFAPGDVFVQEGMMVALPGCKIFDLIDKR